MKKKIFFSIFQYQKNSEEIKNEAVVFEKRVDSEASSSSEIIFASSFGTEISQKNF